jgi:hypothetical protein
MPRVSAGLSRSRFVLWGAGLLGITLLAVVLQVTGVVDRSGTGVPAQAAAGGARQRGFQLRRSVWHECE